MFGGVPMMAILPFFADSVTSELFLKRRQPNSLWMSSGLNVLSPLHCVSSWVSPMRISGQLSRSVWMYFRSSLLVRGCGFTCTSDLVGYGVFFGSISSMILVGFLIPHTMCLLGSYPGISALVGWLGWMWRIQKCFVAFSPSLHIYMVCPYIHSCAGFPPCRQWWGRSRGTIWWYLCCLQCSHIPEVYSAGADISGGGLIPRTWKIFHFFINYPFDWTMVVP